MCVVNVKQLLVTRRTRTAWAAFSPSGWRSQTRFGDTPYAIPVQYSIRLCMRCNNFTELSIKPHRGGMLSVKNKWAKMRNSKNSHVTYYA